jgi:hypothetical protein
MRVLLPKLQNRTLTIPSAGCPFALRLFGISIFLLSILTTDAARSKEATITPTDRFDNYLISEIDRTAQLDSLVTLDADKSVNGKKAILIGGTAAANQVDFNVPSKYVGFTVSFLPDESAVGEFAQIFSYGDLKLGVSVSETEFSLYRLDNQQSEWVLLAPRFEYLREGGFSRFAFLSVVEVDEGVFLSLNARIIDYVEGLSLNGKVMLEATGTLPMYWGPLDVYETVPGFVQKFQNNLTKDKFSGMTKSQEKRHLLRQGFVKAPPVMEGQLTYQEEAWLLSQSLNRRIWEGVVLSAGGDYSAYASGKIPHTTLDIVPNLQGRSWRYPWDQLDAEDPYLEILDGYLIPPETGEYTFWVTGDDYASFHLGSVLDPDNLSGIAETQVALLKDNWDIDGPGRSAPILLEQGKVYLVRAIHHETSGENHFSVGWAKPSDGVLSFPAENVPSKYLSSLASGEPGVMPRTLHPFGQELLTVVPSRETEYQKISSKVIDSEEMYQQLSGSISSSETIELTDFDAGGWALHASLGWVWSDSSNFPWIWKTGSSGYFEPTIDEWYQYTIASASPQIFYKSATTETFKVYSWGIYYVPEFTGDSSQTVNRTVGDSYTFSATLKRYFTPITTYWKLDGSQVATGTIAGNTMSYALSNMMKDEDEGVYTAYVSSPGGSDTSAPTTLNISKAEQSTVNLSSVPSTLIYNAVDDLNASGGSGTGSYGYEVEDPSKGQIVNGDDIKALSGTGTVRVRAYRAADANYNIQYSAWSSPITLQKADQSTVSISSVPSTLIYNAVDDLDASGGSGTGGYGYEVEDPAKGQIVNGDDIKALSGTGTVRVRAYREADDNYNRIDSAWSASITLQKADQNSVTISSVPSTLTFNAVDDLDASGGSGTGSYGYEVEDPAKGQIVNGDDIKALSGTGTVRVRAYREADDNYNRKDSTWSAPISLEKVDQGTVYVSSVPASLTYLLTDDLDASGGSGTGSYGYEVENPSLAQIVNTDDVQSLSGTGPVRVRSFRAGDENYNIRYSAWSAVITLAKADQATVYISSVPSSLTYLFTDDLNASGGSGTGSYLYEVEDPSKGEIINGDDIRALSGTGLVRVRVYREADDNYTVKYSSWSSWISLEKANQSTVYVSSVPSSLPYSVSDDLNASGGSGSGSYGYEVENPAKAEIVYTDDVKALSGTGFVRVRSYRSGDDNYNTNYSAWSSDITLLKMTQTPPTVSGPSEATRNETAYFSASGGGYQGSLEWNSNIDDQGWTSCGNSVFVEDDWLSLQVRVRWSGNDNYSPSGYSTEYGVILLAGSQSAPTSILPTTVERGTFVEFTAVGGGEGGLTAFEYTTNGIDWEGFDRQIFIDPEWPELKIRAKWRGNLFFEASPFSSNQNISLVNSYQEPPEFVDVSSVTKEEQIVFTFSGGGKYGNLIMEYQSDSSNWLTFSNPLFIDTSWASLSVRAKWSGSSYVNESNYSQEFGIRLDEPQNEPPEITITPSNPPSEPLSSSSSSNYSQPLVNSYETSIEDLFQGEVFTAQAVSGDVSVSYDYSLNAQPGQPTWISATISNNSPTTTFTLLPYLGHYPGTGGPFTYIYAGSSLRDFTTVYVPTGTTKTFRFFYGYTPMYGILQNLFVYLFEGFRTPSDNPGGDSLGRYELGTVTSNPSPDLSIFQPDLSDPTDSIVKIEGKNYPRLQNINGEPSVSWETVSAYMNNFNEVTLTVRNFGDVEAGDLTVKVYKKENGELTQIYSEVLDPSVTVPPLWYDCMGPLCYQNPRPGKVNINLSLPYDVLHPGVDQIVFQVLTADGDSQLMNNDISVPVEVPPFESTSIDNFNPLKNLHLYSDIQNELWMEIPLVSNGSPPYLNDWYAVQAWGLQPDGSWKIITDWSYLEVESYENGGNPWSSWRWTAEGNVQFPQGLKAFVSDGVYYTRWSYQQQKWLSSFRWTDSHDIKVGIDENGDGKPDETNGVMVPDDPTSDWEKLVFDSNFPVPKEGTARIERSANKRVEVWREQGSNSLLIGDQLYTEWDLSIPQQRTDFIDILGDGLWIIPDSFSFDVWDGLLTLRIDLPESSLTKELKITSLNSYLLSSNLSAGQDIVVPGHGTIKVISYIADTGLNNSGTDLQLDFVHSGDLGDYGWIQYVVEDTFREIEVPVLDVLEENLTVFFDNNYSEVDRETDIQALYLPTGVFERERFPVREVTNLGPTLRFGDQATTPLGTYGSVRLMLFLYDKVNSSIIYTINWGYNYDTNGTTKY